MIALRRAELIRKIAHFPAELAEVVDQIEPEALDAPCGGTWTARQNIHHLADSHIQGFVRMKLMLAHDNPPIVPYDQDAFVEQVDARTADVGVTVRMIADLHERWVLLLHDLTDEQWGRTGEHLTEGTKTLDDLLAIYAHHGTEHLTTLRTA